MTIQRYSRQLAPSDPKSVPDYLNREHQKLEQSVDSIIKGTAALDGDNTLVGDQTITGNTTLNGDVTVNGSFSVSPASGFYSQFGTDIYVTGRDASYYPSLQFYSSDNVRRAAIYGGLASDPKLYIDAEQFVLENIAENKSYLYGDVNGLDLYANGSVVATIRAAGLSVTGITDTSGEYRVAGTKVVGAQQAAIANDASGAVNQTTVNAILTALRAHGLIAP